MSGKSLRVVAHLVAKPDKVTELRDLLASLITPTRAEPGCIEEWTSGSALDDHSPPTT